MRTEVQLRVGKLKNGRAVSKDEVTGEMIKGEGDRVVDWIWRMCNLAFESGCCAGRMEVCLDCSTVQG